MFKNKNIKISELALNTGQVPGLPKNPRFIRDNRFKDLVKSIQDAPEMLDYRKLLVYPFNGKYVVLCGNMRLRACKEIGYKEMPCMIVPEETAPEKLREYTQRTMSHLVKTIGMLSPTNGMLRSYRDGVLNFRVSVDKRKQAAMHHQNSTMTTTRMTLTSAARTLRLT